MATYSDIYNLALENSALRHKIATAVVVAADTVWNEDPATTNHANRLLWAKDAFMDPVSTADTMIWAVLATNKDASVATIEGATDTAIQNAVNAVIDLFATG